MAGSLGKMLILFGIALIVIGIFLAFFNKIPFLGKLPGDIYISKKNFTFYFPLASGLLISVSITLILWLCSRK